ncbi:MAG: amino acid permease [Candidatus Omnitrophica bacterium]|nr:amino acid permease [Candidatus Omnitrophota bacterium]
MPGATNGHMKKSLGRWDSVAIVIAIVIGVGIFRTPSTVAELLASPALIIAAWTAGGVISALGALCYAELSSSMPRSGGTYVYLRKAYGALPAFLFGWSELLVIRTGSIAALAFIFGEYLSSFLGAGTGPVKIYAALCVVLLALVNMAGMKYGKGVQNIFVAAKIASLGAMLVLGFSSGAGDLAHFSGEGVPDRSLPAAFALALIPVLWTFGGWHENVYMAGETRKAPETLPFALMTGILSITVLYVAVNALYIYLFPAGEIARSGLIASRVFNIVSGRYGQKILEAVIVVSSAAAVNAMLMTGSRIMYAAGRDNSLFAFMNRMNFRTGVPLRALGVTSAWSLLLIFWGNFNRLLYFTGFVFWAFFAASAAGVIVLRKKYPQMERPYRVWGYPLTPLVFSAVSAILAAVTFVSRGTASLTGTVILVSGIPVYLLTGRSK